MNKSIPFEKYIPYGKHQITEDDINHVIEVLKSDWLTQGPKVNEFESKLEEYIGVKNAVVVNNGTTALHLAFAASGMNEQSTMLTTPLTFVATANAALYQKAKIRLIDIDKNTWNMSVDQLTSENDFTHVTPVHFAGLPVEMHEISKIAIENNATLIFDGSHAVGAEYHGNKIGAESGLATTFSFHPVKHVASGEGGAIVTDDDNFANKMRMLRTHGIVKDGFKTQTTLKEKPYYYEMQDLGFNYRISDILCALAISQLNRIEDNIKQRNHQANLYLDLIEDWKQADTQNVDSQIRHAYHIFPIVFKDIGINKRDQIFRELRKLNIGVQVHYIPIPLQPFYQQSFDINDYPNTKYYYENCVTLPLFPSLTDEEIKLCFENLKHIHSQIC